MHVVYRLFSPSELRCPYLHTSIFLVASSLASGWITNVPSFIGPLAEPIDLIVTLGGDGTILHASSLFKVGAVPPVLSFSMGTLGFLLPFRELSSAVSA